ncbi:lipopolysaccharide biosynthesis protein [Roseicyclus sp.]|uniref:lipopolysaccharide biosynthesis protein n=1 Tax=Roseicyclus sp. TaxID=1914329 RepID=UPI003F9FF116
MHAEEPLPRQRGGMARGALAGFAGEGMGLVLALLAAVLLARHLGPEDFGTFGLAAAAAAAVGWSLASLFSRAALVLVAAADDPRAVAGALLRSCLLWGLVAWIAFAGAGVPLAGVIGQPILVAAFAVAGSEVLLLSLSRLCRSVLTATGDYGAPGFGAGLFHAARLGAVGLVILAGGGPVAALLAIAAARCVELAFYGLRLPIPLPGAARGIRLRRIAGPTLLQAVSLQLFHRVDILLLGAFGTAAGALGWYAAAQQVAVIPPLVAGVVAPLATVALARTPGGAGHGDIDRRVDRVAAVGLILFVALAGVAPPLAPLLFGDGFAGAAPLFAWLALGGAGSWLGAIGSGRWAAAGRMLPPAAVSAGGLAVAVAAHVIVIPVHGVTGAAIVTAATGGAAGLLIHLSAPGPRVGRAVETLAALALGGLAAILAHGALGRALGWALGWAA